MQYLYALIGIVLTEEAMGTYNNTDVFAIITEGCAITGFPYISESIRRIVERPENGRNCSDIAPLILTNSSHLWLDNSVFSYYNIWNEDDFYCCYRNFSVINNDISTISYEQCKEFSTVLKVEHEYVRIECYAGDDKVYDDFFLFDVNENVYLPPTVSADYNVIILGFESISRLNFHRTLSLTSKFLQDKGMIELFGYNKLGDNSYPNLFPLLTGKSFEYVKKECVDTRAEMFDVNKCEFVWDKFKNREYLTALVSDSTAGVLGYYEYCLPKIPADFYPQPFVFETRNLFRDKYYAYHQCMGSKYYFKELINYIYGLTRKLSSHNLFGMFWEESVSHEYLNRPHIMDETYYNFVSALESDGYLNNTVLIVLSDHGMRWGEITLTEQGHLEERLPLLGIIFPEQFRRYYTLAFRNVQENSNRLITPFDMHETLLHLLDRPSLSNEFIKRRTNSDVSTHSASSLFYPISERRTCESIGIEDHWCACRRGKKLRPGPKMKPLITRILIAHINNLIKPFPKCHSLNLEKILHVTLTEDDKLWQMYTVIIQTRPGDAIFDGTLVRNHGAWKVSGTVSRLNLYRNQSSCIRNDSIKMYCFCG